jgi:hypothetical protein
MNKKILLAVGMTFLLLAVSLPVTALTTSTETVEVQETAAIEKLMDAIENAAYNSQSMSEFLEKLNDLCESPDYNKLPLLRDLLHKILCYLMNHQGFYVGGVDILDFFEKLPIKDRPAYLVLSYGVYNRLNPRKDNAVKLVKERLSMWRYSDDSKILKGRTLILERQPFGIHQKITGSQLGLMKGFKGIYIDIESKLTGKAYVFFMGRVDHIRVFDLTPRNK